jgi:hypothetical protein
MANRLLSVLAPLAGLAMVSVPGVLTPTVVPAGTACAGGVCEVCPVVAETLRPVGTAISCLA